MPAAAAAAEAEAGAEEDAAGEPYSLASKVALAGGVLAVSLLAMRSMLLRRYVSAGPAWLSRLAEPGENVPYGLAICIGGLAAYPASTLVQVMSAGPPL